VTTLYNQVARVALVSWLALAGNAAMSAEPTQAEVQKAVQDEMKRVSDELKKAFGSDGAKMVPTIHSVKKIACSKVNDKVFTCDIEVESTQHLPQTTRGKAASQLRLVNASDGWRVSK